MAKTAIELVQEMIPWLDDHPGFSAERIRYVRRELADLKAAAQADPIPLARDAFAAAALQGMLCGDWEVWNQADQAQRSASFGKLSLKAYEIADAMLEARKK